MAKKFAEHNGLNLTQTNNDVLAAWEKMISSTSLSTSVKAALSLSSSRDLHQLMATRVFTTCWHVVSRIHSTDTRP